MTGQGLGFGLWCDGLGDRGTVVPGNAELGTGVWNILMLET